MRWIVMGTQFDEVIYFTVPEDLVTTPENIPQLLMDLQEVISEVFLFAGYRSRVYSYDPVEEGLTSEYGIPTNDDIRAELLLTLWVDPGFRNNSWERRIRDLLGLQKE